MSAGDSVPTKPAEATPWAPLQQQWFRLLWIGVLCTYIGTWMQTVGAQWLLVESGAGGRVALVQTANMLPMMLLALPAGVICDVFSRRWVLFTVQAYVFCVAGCLAVLTWLDLVTPVLMLVFTLLIGVGAAVQLPAWQSVIPDLVPRAQLGAATRLEMVGVNFGRAAGPALAGLVIALWGVPSVFALNALSVILFAVTLVRWQRPAGSEYETRERFVPALRAGGRFVGHEPAVLRILARVTIFVLPATILWALLPLVARERLGLEAGGYGALFGALGVGAISAALVVGKVRAWLSSNAVLAVSALIYLVALVVVVEIPSFVAVLICLVFAGLGWTALFSTLMAELQLTLPVWVRARGLAVYLMVFAGCQALASVIWGQVADALGLRLSFLLAAGLVLVGVVVGRFLPIPSAPASADQTEAYWGDPHVADIEFADGKVLIRVDYTVAADRQTDYLEAMVSLHKARRRTGAIRWELYRDAERPNRFVEMFWVASWEEHLRQHEGRLTAADRQIEETALAFSNPWPQSTHLLEVQ